MLLCSASTKIPVTPLMILAKTKIKMEFQRFKIIYV